MRRGGEDPGDELAALIEAAGPVEVPEDLGNLPPDQSTGPMDDGEPAPEPVRAEEPDAGEDDEAQPGALRALQTRIDALQRETEFLRRAQPPAPAPVPADPRQLLHDALPFAVTETDLAAIAEGGAKGAEYLQNALRVAALSGADLAVRQVRRELSEGQGAASRDQAIRDLFWSQNGDLAEYPDIVQSQANAAWQERPNASASELVALTGERTRARLRQMGVNPRRASQAAPARIRPARGDSGGRSGGNGRGPANGVEREIFQLMNAR